MSTIEAKRMLSYFFQLNMATPTSATSPTITVVHGDGIAPEIMAATATALAEKIKKVWPGRSPETFCTDSFRCRFMGASVTPKQVIALQDRVIGLGLEIAMTENLRNYDGKAGFTLAQGQ